MKKKLSLATGIMAAVFAVGLAGAQAMAGPVAQGNISVYKDGKLSDKFTGQNPVDEEALLVCDGKCMVKSTGVSLVGSDKAELSVKSDKELFSLLLNQGQVDFSVTDHVGKIAFYGPKGQYTIADVVFNAATEAPVRGYMQVAADGSTKIGVREGRMVFSTAQGPKVVDSNNYILLAQSDVGGSDDAASSSGEEEKTVAHKGKWWQNKAVLIGGGVVAAGVAAAAIIASNNDDDDSNNSGNGSSGSSESKPGSAAAGTSGAGAKGTAAAAGADSASGASSSSSSGTSSSKSSSSKSSSSSSAASRRKTPPTNPPKRPIVPSPWQ